MFVDETKFLIANHPNIYATMEATALLCLLNPPAFANLIEQFVGFAGPDKVIYASAAVNSADTLLLSG